MVATQPANARTSPRVQKSVPTVTVSHTRETTSSDNPSEVKGQQIQETGEIRSGVPNRGALIAAELLTVPEAQQKKQILKACADVTQPQKLAELTSMKEAATQAITEVTSNIEERKTVPGTESPQKAVTTVEKAENSQFAETPEASIIPAAHTAELPSKKKIPLKRWQIPRRWLRPKIDVKLLLRDFWKNFVKEIDLESDEDHVGKIQLRGKPISRIQTLGGTPICLQVVNGATWTPFLPKARFLGTRCTCFDTMQPLLPRTCPFQCSTISLQQKQMLLRFLATFLVGFGALRGVMVVVVQGECIGAECSQDNSLGQKRSLSAPVGGPLGFAPSNSNNDENNNDNDSNNRNKLHHHHYQRTTICFMGCPTDDNSDNKSGDKDKNAIGEECGNCCCRQATSPGDNHGTSNGSSNADKVTAGNSCDQAPAIDCETAMNGCDPSDSAEGCITTKDMGNLATRSGTSSAEKIDSSLTCPPPAPCPPPPPCPPPAPCPEPSSTPAPTKKNPAFLLLPQGAPVIPSPQLDLLTGAAANAPNIQDLRLSTIKPPRSQPLVQEPGVDNFPPHDCCTGCSVASCNRARSKNALHGASTFNDNSTRDAKCNNGELKKVMLAHIKKDPARSKRAIQRAAEEKFAGKFNVICSKGDFNYITHTTIYCEAAGRGNTCYAFKTS